MPTNFKRASFDVKASMRFGLENAVFCYWLLGVCGSGQDQGGRISINREKATSDTSLGVESQLACQSSLRKLGIVDYDDHDPDSLSFDLAKYSLAVRCDDAEFRNAFPSANKRKSDARKAKKAFVSKSLKVYIDTDDSVVRDALEHWVDSLVDSGKITKETVVRFQDTLNGYANGNRFVALDVIDTAIANKYPNCVWAIESYEREKRQGKPKATSAIKVATKGGLSEKRY